MGTSLASAAVGLALALAAGGAALGAVGPELGLVRLAQALTKTTNTPNAASRRNQFTVAGSASARLSLIRADIHASTARVSRQLADLARESKVALVILDQPTPNGTGIHALPSPARPHRCARRALQRHGTRG